MNKYHITLLILTILMIVSIYFYYNKKNNESFYNISNKPYLWLYWDPPINGTPGYIQICYDSVVKHCSESFVIVRLNKDNIKTFLPEIIGYEKYINNMKIAHKVDLYRILLLYKFGGLYLDSDILVLHDLIQIVNKLNNNIDYVGFGCTGDTCKYGYGYPSNWAMVSKPNTELMYNVMNNIINKIIKFNANNFVDMDYHEIGKSVLWEELGKLIKNNKYKYYHYPNNIDGTRDKYGKWVTNEIIFSNKKIEYDNPNGMLFLVLYNSGIDNNIKNMSKGELLSKDYNFSILAKQ